MTSQNKILVVGGSGFIGSYLMREIQADNLDLKEGQDVRDGIKGEYEVIIFLACNQENNKAAYLENQEMFEVLNNYCKLYKFVRLIYISSAAIYNLTSWYALSKQLGEAYVSRFYNHIILRLSNVYGHGEGHGAPDRFMRGENIIYGDGSQKRDLIPVEQIVSAIINASRSFEMGVFNVSSGTGTTVNQMYGLFGSGKQPNYESGDYGIQESILIPGKVL